MQVMERYLQVKKIAAPVDEFRFVVDAVHHTLAPELTPEDFKLQGACVTFFFSLLRGRELTPAIDD